jgi:hypothetical protein
MTDLFAPVSLSLTTNTETLATAAHEATAPILMGEALRLIIAERLEQVTRHGNTLEHDLCHDQAELAQAAMAYLGAAIDLALRPDKEPTGIPDSWPFQHDFWKEPGPDDRIKALTKAATLIWAELDREIAARDLIHAARPLV